MCTVCGCSEGNVSIDGKPGGVKYPYRPRGGHTHHGHDHDHGHHHHHDHDHHHDHTHREDAAADSPVVRGEGRLDYGQGAARAHAPGLSQSRMVKIEQDILSKNKGYAQINRRWLADRGIFAVNLVSSPGSGKTTLLAETIRQLGKDCKVYVIEGDQQTSNDAERIRAAGAPAIQINTGKGCHLDAHMVGQALETLHPADDSLLLIENVGNLVCPAAFDLGEAHKVAILSVTEGEDKPIKYPDMFAAADILLLNKVDLLRHLDFDVDACIAYARRVNPAIRVLQVSARSGEGMDAWIDWLLLRMNDAQLVKQHEVARLKARIAELEQQLQKR
ncbi:hydrogenase nickel incorporation protein HypB [uncultured Aquitalea sp.]|uniref:hydrogenase nickel incorporation protein HypB n=1 Tax=uncultured Aquitalea sp. TaxID=540272 RepID=UPI0025DDCB78|nr:hydrogenase nickel incorporation protein HypB [uncultured Aquitalea sp.]